MNQARKIWNSILYCGYDLNCIAVETKKVNPFAFLACLADVQSSFGEDIKNNYIENYNIYDKKLVKEAYDYLKEDCFYNWGVWQLDGITLYKLNLQCLPKEMNIFMECKCVVDLFNTDFSASKNLEELVLNFYKSSENLNKIVYYYDNRRMQLLDYYNCGDESILNN